MSIKSNKFLGNLVSERVSNLDKNSIILIFDESQTSDYFKVKI